MRSTFFSSRRLMPISFRRMNTPPFPKARFPAGPLPLPFPFGPFMSLSQRRLWHFWQVTWIFPRPRGARSRCRQWGQWKILIGFPLSKAGALEPEPLLHRPPHLHQRRSNSRWRARVIPREHAEEHIEKDNVGHQAMGQNKAPKRDNTKAITSRNKLNLSPP